MQKIEIKLTIDENTTLEGVLQIIKKDIVIQPLINPLQALTDYWFSKNATITNIVSIPSENNIFNLTSPTGGEKFSLKQTPAGRKGSFIEKYDVDGGFIRILNTINHCVATKEIPENDQSFETFVVCRIPSGGFVPYEAVVSGSSGLKYISPQKCEIFSYFKGIDSHQPIELNLTEYADKIIILNFVHTLRTCELNIIDDLGTKTYKVLFPVDKPFTSQSIGTQSHPTITDFFAGAIKVNGTLTNEERQGVINEYKKTFDFKAKYDYYKPIITYLQKDKIFKCNLNSKVTTKVEDLYFRWFKYDQNGATNSPIDNRIVLSEGLGVDTLTRDETILPGSPVKHDVVVDVFDKNLEYKFTSLPYGKYW